MDTLKFEKKDTLVIAHRGLSGLEIENTEEAFRAAAERSYYGIEADVRKTADGAFVMCHDETLNNIAGIDVSVEKSTLSYLQSITLKLGKKEGAICTLESYISICKEYEKQAFLELKSIFSEEEIVKIIEIIENLDYINGVTFISFDYNNLMLVRRYLPNHSVQYLCSEIDREMTENLIRNGIAPTVSHKKITKELIDTFHNAGLCVGVWTVDEKEKAENLVRLGVDFITTNILE